MSVLIRTVAAVPVAALALSLAAAPGVAGTAEKGKPAKYPAAFSFSDGRDDTAMTVTSADVADAQQVSDAADVRKVQVKSSKKGVRVVVSMVDVPAAYGLNLVTQWKLTAQHKDIPVPVVVNHSQGAIAVEETGLLTPVQQDTSVNLPTMGHRPVVRTECLEATVVTRPSSDKVIFTVPRSCLGEATALTGFTVETAAWTIGAEASDKAASSKTVRVHGAKGPGYYVDSFIEFGNHPGKGKSKGKSKDASGKDRGVPVRDSEFFSR